VTVRAGLLAKAAIATSHARLAERGEWVVNEKGIVERAGLGGVEAPLRALDVAAVRAALDG